MIHCLKETWLPTAMFAGLSGLIATADLDKGVIHYAPLITALIVVPLVWKSFVIRQGCPRIRRGVLAGSAAASMILWSEVVIDGVRRFIHGKHGEEGLGGLFMIIIPFIALIGALLGAGLASLAAFLQARLWPGPPEELGATDLALDGAVGGALVATLVAPFAAVIPLVVLRPDQRYPTMNLAMFTGGTWLALAPAGAWLGVKAARRWRRIMTSPGAADPPTVG